ncbi:AsmA family protein [Parvibaculum lavamentivorans DS-1]|uniref:AsmA family protein n=1 Tax=Parvibaculum lavamentivorans (strain DS-1 / DSM 13023 / NCIMB 13966) TaxID=402881 RepID=A7HVW9_PARL1|nr:AsmA family protein [Parvibaculum lavamentivorans]ABS64052.1 AsmA family protein [Parvibaculum lavamentivorans DS-1]
MNSILTYIAGLLVVLLFAALVGPSLVDWNQFRTEIETQASQAAARPVSIDGDIRFRILPAPHLTLGKIKIGNDPDASSLPSDPHFATFEEIDAEMALAPLLSGDIQITSVRIVRPQINLEVLPDGSVNWRGLNVASRIPKEGMFSLASISLEKASFENGTVNYRNRVNGRRWKAQQVQGSVIATSLLGPLRSEFEATIGDVPLAFRIGMGNFAGDKAFRVTTEMRTLDHPVKFLFSGVATDFSLAARLDGNGRLEVGAETDREDGTKTSPIRVDAGMVLNARRASLRNLSVVADGAALRGSAEARWEQRPSMTLRLTAESFSLDAILAKITAESEGKEVVHLLPALLSVPVPAWLDGNVHFEADALTVGKALVRGALIEASLRDGTLDLDTVRGEFGGSTQLSMSGALEQREDGPHFDGTAQMESGNIAAFAYWISSITDTANGARATPRGSPFAARARLRATPGEFAVENLVADYARDLTAPDLRGGVVYRAAEERPSLALTLDIRDFDFDPLMALLPQEADPLAFLASHDVELALDAERLTAFERTLRGVDADMSLTAGKVTVSALDVDDIAGASLSFSGALDGVTTGKRDDVKGNFSGTIRAEHFGGLLDLGGFDVPDVEGPVELLVTGASGEADDSQARVDTLTLQGTVRGSRVDGVVKRRHEASGGLEGLDIIANATNSEGRILLEQLGLSPRADLPGAGSVAVQLVGGRNGTYDTNFRANVNGTTLTARGEVAQPFEALRFTGRAEIAASGVLHALGAFGAPAALTAWVGEQASGPGFVFSSDVVWDKESLELKGFESVAGNFHLSGTAGWKAGTEGGLPSVSGVLEANALDLTSLAVADKEDGDIWPVAALDWSLLGAFDGGVELKAGRLSLGTVAISDVETQVTVSHGVLTASPFAGRFAGGRVSAGARVEGGAGEPGVGLTLAVQEADVARAFGAALGATPGTGKFDLDVQLQGQGRSWFSLVSSVTGAGTIRFTDAAFRPVDVAGFGAALVELQSVDAFAPLVEKTLRAGATAASDIGGEFMLEDGVLRFADDAVSIEGGSAQITALYDLPRLISQAELTVTLNEPASAPTFSIEAAGKGTQMTVETETLALQNFVARRILRENVRDAGADLPQDLRDLMDLPQDNAAVPLPRPSL